MPSCQLRAVIGEKTPLNFYPPRTRRRVCILVRNSRWALTGLEEAPEREVIGRLMAMANMKQSTLFPGPHAGESAHKSHTQSGTVQIFNTITQVRSLLPQTLDRR